MPSKELKIEDFDRVLVVEGYSDLLFYAEMLEEVGKHGRVFIKELGGKSDFNEKLETLITPGLLESKAMIGFLVDADECPEQTCQSLKQLLSRLSKQTVLDGQWSQGKPRIGLFVIPGGGVKGEIETLVWKSWASDPKNNAQKRCIESYIECMVAANFKAHSPDKGLIGALLAIRSDEDPRLGPGARSNIFNLKRPELEPLRIFLSAF